MINLTQAEANGNDLLNRDKRSFSWVPPFLGGPGSSSSQDVDEVVSENENEVVPSFLDSSVVGSIINRGELVNNQMQYPIWRVHKYNGVHLAPLPVHVVPAPNLPSTNLHATTVVETAPIAADADILPEIESDSDTTADDDTPKKQSTPPNPLELLKLARDLGVTDFSKIPDLNEIGSLLGTTTPEETIEAIKEFAATEDGRQLIRDYIQGQSTSENNDVAASEINENYDLQKGSETNLIPQILGGNSNGGSPFPLNLLTNQQRSASTAEEVNDEGVDSDEGTTPRSSVLERIGQWTSALNPFAGRQEIPIPPIGTDVNNAENTIQYSEPIEPTVPLPSLPKLPLLPNIPALNQPLPELPNIRIPLQYASPYPLLPQSNGNGQYVRVKLPLAGFNPTPQIPIDAHYLNHARNTLQFVQLAPRVLPQQGLPQQVLPQQFVPYITQPVRTFAPQPIYNQLPPVQSLIPNQFRPTFPSSTPVAVNTPAQAPIEETNQTSESLDEKPIQVTDTVAEPIVEQNDNIPQTNENSNLPSSNPAQSFQENNANINTQNVPQNIQLPQTQYGIPFRSVNRPISQNIQLPVVHRTIPFRGQVKYIARQNPYYAKHVGDLPLAQQANYEAFRNAPRIMDSYGKPVLPISFPLDNPTNVFQLPQNSSRAFVQQEYNLVPSQSETIETTVNQNGDAIIDANLRNDNNDDGKSAVETTDSNEKNDNAAATKNDKRNEKKIENEANEEDTFKIDIRDNLNSDKSNESNQQTSHIQRITPHDSQTGKMFHADPKAVDLLPFTLINRSLDMKNDNHKKTETHRSINRQ